MRVKLGDIYQITSGGTPKKGNPEYYENGSIPWIKTGDLKGKNIESYETITESGLQNSSAKLFPENTVLLAMYGATIGNCAILDFDASTNQACAAFLPNDLVLPEYLYYFLLGKKKQFIKDGVGGAQPNISATYLKKVNFELISIEEQIRIVSVLDKLSGIIDNRAKQLQTLDELIKARFVEMFGEKNHPENTLLNLCNIIDYRGKTPEKVDSGLPFITAKNIKMHYMTLEPREYISKETYEKVMVRGFPKEGDVVFTTEAPLGNVCRIPRFDTKFYIGQRIVTMQTEILNPIYLEYALSDESFKRKYMSKSSGSTVTGIRVRLLEQLTIPVPPTDLQNEFADFVKQVDKSKVVVQKALDEAQLLFDSLMQQYFG